MKKRRQTVYLEWGRRVLAAEAEAVRAAGEGLGSGFEESAHAVAGCRGRVVVAGLGKSGHVGRKIAATLNSLGIPAVFLHAAEALHGDAGVVARGDVLVAVSHSGGSRELAALIEVVRGECAAVIAITANPASALGRAADHVIDTRVKREADHLDLAPTASSTAALAVGDALAVAAARARGFSARDFARLHPGGALGKKASRRKD
ncbi:MAG: SIS domain-containing protein [bacterium]